MNKNLFNKKILLYILLTSAISCGLIQVSGNFLNLFNKQEIDILTTRDGFIPNKPVWVDIKSQTVNVEGYNEQPESDFGYGYESGKLRPDKSSEYYDWFTDQGDWLGLYGGGNNHTGQYIYDLGETTYTTKPEDPLDSVTYMVEEVRITNFNIHSEYGAIGGVSLPEIWDSYGRPDTKPNDSIGVFNYYDENISKSETDSGESAVSLMPNSIGQASDWTTVYTFDNGGFPDEWRGSSGADPVIKYSWEKGSDKIYFNIENVNDWVFALLGGTFHFASSVTIDAEKKMVVDDGDYSLAQDEFGYDENSKYYKATQKNFDSMGKTSTSLDDEKYQIYMPKHTTKDGDETIIRPFFNSDYTFGELETFIIRNNILVSRDELNTNLNEGNLSIKFYDPKNIDIDNPYSPEEHLNSSQIAFKLVSNERLKNGEIVSSETEILRYEIPYVDVQLEPVQNNIYDYGNIDDDNEYTDNNSKFSWEYDDIKNIWTLKTNVPLGITGSADQGLSSISYEDEKGNITEIKFSTEEVGNSLTEVENFTHKQIKNSKSNPINTPVYITDSDSNKKGVKFNYQYVPYSDEERIILKDASGSEASIVEGFDNQRIVLNSVNGKAESDKILKGTVVDSPFIVDVKDEHKDSGILLEFNEANGEWNKQDDETFSFGSPITDPGIYGVSTYDEYGNNSFRVIELVNPKTREETQNSILYEDSENSSLDYEVFAQQNDSANIEDFNEYSSLELRYMEQYIDSGEMVDIKETLDENPINETLLEKTSNDFTTGVAFGQEVSINGNATKTSLKQELEQEISKEVEKVLPKGSYDIKWTNVKDDTLITNDMTNSEITYEIIPDGYWLSKGVWSGSFEPKVYTDISSFVFNTEKLSDITNNFEDGISPDEIIIDEYGNQTTLNKELEKEVKQEIIKAGTTEEIINDSGLEVYLSGIGGFPISNIHYGDTLYLNVNTGFVSSNLTPLMKGNQNISFSSQTRINISDIKIDANRLTEITNNYFIGTTFKSIKGELVDEIYYQLANPEVLETGELSHVPIERSEVNVTIDTPDITRIEPGQTIGFTITPTTSKFADNIEGEFVTNPFTSLNNLKINNRELVKITNKYQSGTEFGEIRSELETYLINNLDSRGLPTNEIKFDWSIDDEELIEFNTEIGYSITPIDPTNTLIQGEFNSSFNAANNYNLSEFVLDQEAINNIVDPFIEQGEVMFDVIKPLLNEEINRQLIEQGYATHITLDDGSYIQVINIDWNRGDGERIVLGQSMEFSLYSDNKLINEYVLQGELQASKIQFGVKPELGFNINPKVLMEILIIFMLIITMLMFVLVIKQKVRNKRL